jgi:hypothetical protein
MGGASSTTKTGHHDIAEILLKVALNTKIQIQIHLAVVLFILRFTVSDYPFGILDLRFLITPEYPERTTDPGQATGKLYHLRQRPNEKEQQYNKYG